MGGWGGGGGSNQQPSFSFSIDASGEMHAPLDRERMRRVFTLIKSRQLYMGIGTLALFCASSFPEGNKWDGGGGLSRVDLILLMFFSQHAKIAH